MSRLVRKRVVALLGLALIVQFGTGCLFRPANLGKWGMNVVTHEALEFLLDNDTVLDLFAD